MWYTHTGVKEMPKHMITDAEYSEVKELSKKNQNKRVDKRLQVIILRYEGMNYEEIADKLGYTPNWVSKLCASFKRKGAPEYARHKYGGNHQAIAHEKEKEILEGFRAKAESGQVVTVMEIKKAFDEYRGKDTGRGYIYMLLARHKWRMVMPRGKHPKGQDEEGMEASKKLTINTRN